jgi:hypothetical protein
MYIFNYFHLGCGLSRKFTTIPWVLEVTMPVNTFWMTIFFFTGPYIGLVILKYVLDFRTSTTHEVLAEWCFFFTEPYITEKPVSKQRQRVSHGHLRQSMTQHSPSQLAHTALEAVYDHETLPVSAVSYRSNVSTGYRCYSRWVRYPSNQGDAKSDPDLVPTTL